MADGKTPKKRPAAKKPTVGDGAELVSPHVHLIRIADWEAMKRAVTVLGEVRIPYCGLTDSRMLVHNDHLAVLRSEVIPFELLS